MTGVATLAGLASGLALAMIAALLRARPPRLAGIRTAGPTRRSRAQRSTRATDQRASRHADQHAGRHADQHVDRRAGRVVVALGGVIATVAIVGIIPMIAAMATIGFTRRWRRVRRAARDQAERARLVPELLDVLIVLLDAGSTPTLALRAATPHVPPALRDDLAAVVTQLDVGVRLVDALATLVERLGEPVRLLVDTIVRADTYGDPLAPLLARLQDDAVRQRRTAAEVAARQLPVRLCFPLACCTLPAFVVLTIVPLLAGAFSSLRLASP